MKKRLGSIVLTLALALSLLPWSAMPARAADWTNVGTWAELETAVQTGGNIKLTANVTMEGGLEIGKDKSVTLDLNGKTLSASGSGITVVGSFVLQDSKGGGVYSGSSSWNPCVYLSYGNYPDDAAPSFTLKSGTISGGRTVSEDGSVIEGMMGVKIRKGSFTMEGGTITGCSFGVYTMDTESDYGVGGSVTMTGGAITGCGTGVETHRDSTFDLSGGTITENTNEGVSINIAAFTMSGGKISKNLASGIRGCGLSEITMSGGVISGNSGHGVYVSENCTFKMSGGEISGNRNNGIYAISDVVLIMSGGKIRGNCLNGGNQLFGVFLTNTTFTMSGGEITGNINGGGIYVDEWSSFLVSGKVLISGNGDLSGYWGTVNVWLTNTEQSKAWITVKGALDPASKIGVQPYLADNGSVLVKAADNYTLTAADKAAFSCDRGAYDFVWNHNKEGKIEKQSVYVYASSMYIGDGNSNDKYASFNYTSSAPESAILLACRYDKEGRFVQMQMHRVADSPNNGNAWVDNIGGFSFDYVDGDTFRLMLVNGSTFAPLCRAWSSAG